VEIELSVTFAPELGEAVSAAAAEAGLPLSEWLAQAALREFLDEYQAEHGAFTDEEMAEASRKLGLPWPPEEDDDERARA
jgi:hypothetical protein